MYKAGIMGLTMPFGGTVTVTGKERGSGITCHIQGMVSLMHFSS